MRRFGHIPLLLVLLCLPTAVGAHQQGSSYSSWVLQQGPAVSVRISELDLTRVGLDPQYTDAYQGKVVDYLQSHLRLWVNQASCVADAGRMHKFQPGWLLVSWSFDCAQNPKDKGNDAEWAIETDILLQSAPNHLHFARWQSPNGNIDRVLSLRDSRWQLAMAEPQSSGFGSFLELGVIHILEGWDHLAFVLALLLLANHWRSLLWLISGFTLGHSATLVAATLGWLAPNIVLIEAVIAWSIALVAVEFLALKRPAGYWLLLPLFLLLWALWQGVSAWLLFGLALFAVGYFAALQAAPKWQSQSRAAVTVAFGLIHGCGFASVLGALSLPNADMASSLLGFNLGVELGQLLVVAIAWPLLAMLQRHWQMIPNIIAVLLLGLASFWWTTRLL
jgi:hypothetical protein